MFRSIFIALGGILCGLCIGYVLIFYTPLFSLKYKGFYLFRHEIQASSKQVVGFMPYWLLGKNKTDYSNDITTLTYFGLTIGNDGHIVKLADAQQEEPGWAQLQTNRARQILKKSKQNGVRLSLLVFSGDSDAINDMVSDPENHAKNLIQDVIPIMHRYGFTDLNLDVEDTEFATSGAQLKFTQFVKTIKKGLNNVHAGTLSIEISPSDLINKRLIDTAKVGRIVDSVIIMGYDYHYIGSSVTGPVAPLFGAGISLEYDVQAAVQQALKTIPSRKIILGIPLYGYEWETIGDMPHSAVIPTTGLTASSSRVAQVLSSCASCSAQYDPVAQEAYFHYKDNQSGTYHQFVYPDARSTLAKINFVNDMKLSGVALWALGYEDTSILLPLENYGAQDRVLTGM